MFVAEKEEMLFEVEVVQHQEIKHNEKVYRFLRVNHGVQRGDIANLSCCTYRNEEERHNLRIYHVISD